MLFKKNTACADQASLWQRLGKYPVIKSLGWSIILGLCALCHSSVLLAEQGGIAGVRPAAPKAAPQRLPARAQNQRLTGQPLKWQRQAVLWDAQQHQLLLGKAKLGLGYDMVCGYYDNQAEYASFGLERQIYKCSKIVIPLQMRYAKWQVNLQWAPLYDSVQAKDTKTNLIYAKDSAGRNIKGNPYVDWYKNLGTRLYYLGDIPLLESYIAYHFTSHQLLRAGRLIEAQGLQDGDTPWGDDAMFSPYAYWLSRDLLSGVDYRWRGSWLWLKAGILSGNNPMKGYANYLGRIQSPNLKANNTPSWIAQVAMPLAGHADLLPQSRIMLGMRHDTMNSTYAAAIADGKRRNNVYAAAWTLLWPLASHWQLHYYGQYTWYLSGLTTDSNQFHPAAYNAYKFRNITQQGIFTGLEIQYRQMDLAYTFAMFDRFDANVYAQWINHHSKFGAKSLHQLEQMHSYTHTINAQYHFNSVVALQVNYQAIVNPLRWVSDILDTKPDYRFGAALALHF